MRSFHLDPDLHSFYRTILLDYLSDSNQPLILNIVLRLVCLVMRSDLLNNSVMERLLYFLLLFY